MYQGPVNLVSQRCAICDYAVVQPRTDQTYDKYAKETIIEAVWMCPRCGSRFASGIIERIPDAKK